MNASVRQRVSVAVVGGGPNGMAVANLLGEYGIDVVVIEKERQILDYPRAVGMDDESLRLFQSVGLASTLVRDMIQNVPLRMFRADGTCFADIRPGTREFGWWRRNIFMQQLAEKTLRQGLERYPNVDVRLGHEVVRLEQDDSRVTLEIADADGDRYQLDCDYCVGADGGRSAVRQMLGIPLVGKTHAIKWVVVDVKNATVDAPYTALNCDPRRPNVCIYLPYGYRRWEFLVFPHEDAQAIAEPASVRELLKPYVADPDKLEIVRARTYTHHSRVAERFVSGRVALIGDAAHLSPPWIGQGLNSGLRDAGNLAWKLAGIVRGQLKPEVLQTYEAERHRHSKAMIDLADTFGSLLMPTSRIKAGLRDTFFKAVRLLPGIRDYVLQMRFKPMPRYESELVLPTAGADAIGQMLIQPDVEDESGARVKLDDVLGNWFAIIGWGVNPQSGMNAKTLDFWRGLGARFVQIHRACSGSHPRVRATAAGDCIQVEDVDNHFADWVSAHPCEVIVLRPDRYIAALARLEQLSTLTERFQAQAGAERVEQKKAA